MGIQDTLHKLADSSLSTLGCVSYGIALSDSKTTAELAKTELSKALGHEVLLAHDERKAPYLVNEEETDAFFSLSDEAGLSCCLWAVPKPGSDLLGVGVDLARAEDFSNVSSHSRNASLRVFTEQELVLDIPNISQDDQLMAVLFSCKESAFKSCAQPLRNHYRISDEQLHFETRDFEVMQDGTARGISRIGDAKSALEVLGIGTIQLNWAIVDGLIASCAVAVR